MRSRYTVHVATNQITGTGNHREMLETLTDEQLDEQIVYYGELVAGASSDHGRWSASKLLSTAWVVKHGRSQSGSTDSV